MNVTKPIRMSLVVAALATSAHADSGEAALQPHDLWRAWSWDPVIVIALLLSASFYLRGLLAMRRAGALHSITRWQVMSFAAGWFALVVALLSPLHRLGSAL